MPDVYGGAEKQCKRLSGVLQRAGAEITILTSTQRKTTSTDDDGLAVVRLYSKKAPDLLGRWSLYSLLWLTRVVYWGIKNRRSFDIIHCHQGKFGAFVGCVLGCVTRTQVIIKIGNSGADMDLLCLKRKVLWGYFAYHFVRQCRPTLIAISREIEQQLTDLSFANVIRIPNGIDRNIAVEGDAGTQTEYVNLFYHGRIEPIKRLDLLIKAFELLNNPKLRLHIYGDGTELEAVRQLAERSSCGAHIIFHGAKNNILADIYNKDIFINSSRSEGFSNSLLEALLLGKIMVSTNVSGASEAIEDGVNGAIAAVATPPCLAQAIERALNIFTHGREMATQECKRKINEVFDMELITQKYLTVYEGLA